MGNAKQYAPRSIRSSHLSKSSRFFKKNTKIDLKRKTKVKLTFSWLIPARTVAKGGGNGSFNINSATEHVVQAKSFACIIFSLKSIRKLKKQWRSIQHSLTTVVEPFLNWYSRWSFHRTTFEDKLDNKLHLFSSP